MVAPGFHGGTGQMRPSTLTRPGEPLARSARCQARLSRIVIVALRIVMDERCDRRSQGLHRGNEGTVLGRYAVALSCPLTAHVTRSLVRPAVPFASVGRTMQTTPGPSASAHPEPSRRPAERASSAASPPPRLGRETGSVPARSRGYSGPGQPSSAASGRAFTAPGARALDASALRLRKNRRKARPWVGRSYLHLVFPAPALDARNLRLLD